MMLLDFTFYTFVVVVIIQVYFYSFIFGRFAFSKQNRPNHQIYNPVSVIVCAKNEAKNLKSFLPSILNQEYPKFEIILINDASNDDTLSIMEAFKTQHQNVKIVNIKSIKSFWGSKKHALTLGIKASSFNFVLLTDADCKPLSKYWIKEMSVNFNKTKTIVLGYGSYAKIKNSLLNKLIRFETLLTAVHYFSFAKTGMPYMGVGRNLAYAKKEFFNTNGFVTHIKVRSGDDDLFINQIANNKNTAISFSKNSFTESTPKKTFNAWYRQKKRHVSTAQYYKLKHKILLTLVYASQLLFWLIAIILSINHYKWPTVISLLIFRLILQFIVLGKSSNKLGETDLIFLFPFLEFFLIITQLTIFINNLISKPNYWK